jgi:hypothetical protein
VSESVSAFSKISSLTRWPSSARKSDSHTMMPRCDAASSTTKPSSIVRYVSASRSVLLSDACATASTMYLPTYAIAAGRRPATKLSPASHTVIGRLVSSTSANARRVYSNNASTWPGRSAGASPVGIGTDLSRTARV